MFIGGHRDWTPLLLFAGSIWFYVYWTKQRLPRVTLLIRQHLTVQGATLVDVKPEWLFPRGSWMQPKKVTGAYRALFDDINGERRSRLYGWASWGPSRGLQRWAQDQWIDA